MELNNSSSDLGANYQQTFKLFFERFYPSFCLFANKFLDDQEVSQDIVQDAFLYLWKKYKDFHSESSAKSYLYKYIKDKSLNYLRDKKRKIELAKKDSYFFFRDNIIEEETYNILFDAIRLLSPQSQRVIELSLDGLKNQEIAEKLNISINTVKTIKLRAYSALRNELKENIFLLFILRIMQDLN
jgi:RNA polymerase sigma-70 factor (family 1)